MGIADAVKPVQKVTVDELAVALAQEFAVVTFGAPGAEADDKIEIDLQLTDIHGNPLAKAEVLRITCTDTATMSLGSGALGTILQGDNSADLLIQTDAATGTFSLEVSQVGEATVSLICGATQGSGFVSCKNTVDLNFAA
jgi:hypothetical protein